MDLITAITAEVEGITGLMDSIIEKVQSLKAQGVDVTDRDDFKSKVRALNLVVAGTPSDGVSNAAETVSRTRLTEDETKSIDGVLMAIIKNTDKAKGIHIGELKQQFENDPLIKANAWQDKLQARLTKLKKLNAIKYQSGKSNKEGGRYFSS